jgi:uncharacterized protein YlxP (DUF503 family)
MVVGVCRISFSLPGNDSLKGKRSIVRRIASRTRNRFNAAVAEVSEMDSHRRAVLGFAVVSNDARHANSMLDRITSFVAGVSEAVLTERSLEILHVSGELGSVPPLSSLLDDSDIPDDEED